MNPNVLGVLVGVVVCFFWWTGLKYLLPRRQRPKAAPSGPPPVPPKPLAQGAPPVPRGLLIALRPGGSSTVYDSSSGRILDARLRGLQISAGPDGYHGALQLSGPGAADLYGPVLLQVLVQCDLERHTHQWRLVDVTSRGSDWREFEKRCECGARSGGYSRRMQEIEITNKPAAHRYVQRLLDAAPEPRGLLGY